MRIRKIVEIDEAKCDGCGLCVPACAEGAIQIVQGKARLVSDVYCDGLGACLGNCPRDAITITEREAAPFDEAAALEHVAQSRAPRPECEGGCPGTAVRSLSLNVLPSGPAAPRASGGRAALANWPVQLHLVPPHAPFLEGADLVLVADCVPFACPEFHQTILRGRPVVIGCPKLDDGQAYVGKLAAMLQTAAIRSLTVVHMEVPCCTGLVRIAGAALQAAGSPLVLDDVTVSIAGQVQQAE